MDRGNGNYSDYYLAFFLNFPFRVKNGQGRIGMKLRNSKVITQRRSASATDGVVEEVIAQKLADITTILHTSNVEKSRLHDYILSTVERSLFKIALKRSNNVKGTAAAYLGINRNTFQKKMVKLGIDDPKG